MAKRASCIRLLNSTQSGIKKYWKVWSDRLKHSTIAMQSFASINLFEKINSCYSDHLNGLLNDRATEEREELIEGLG
jgi:hypothetical protein